MNLANLNLTPQQLEVYVTLQKVSQAWTAMIWMFILFTVGFISFLYAIFEVPEQAVAKGIVGAIDTLMVVFMHYIFRYLFPSPVNRTP
jgi:hypothetical protein